MCIRRILLLTILLVAQLSYSKLTRLNLTDWQFTVAGKFEGKSYPATVPSTVHLDLLANKLIEDPYLKANADDLQWISQSKVTYTTTFQLPASSQPGKHAELVFKGIDTYAQVLFNGLSVLHTSNAFVRYTVEVTPKAGDNTIEVRFEPSVDKDENSQTKKERLPFAYGHTRKAAYQHGWDWAPKLVSVGIWKDTYLQYSIDTARLDYVWIRNSKLTTSEALLNVAAALKLFKNTNKHTVKLTIDGAASGAIETDESGVGYLDVAIKDPRYWWPRNVGNPNVYEFMFTLVDSSGAVLDTARQLYGIRTVELNTTSDDFQFLVNGHAVYAKGANYVPPDMLYPRFTNPKFKAPFTLSQYMDTIEQSNYNMIRVWGGGQYESNEFYEECTKRGIMVFQDFMYSVNIYPASEQFLRLSEQEVKQQIRRLRNYASIVLWSGNNEILQGILAWGWGSPSYRRNYKLLFEDLIPKILKNESPDISYIPSSPQYGAGGGDRGDIHSWSVWAGGALFDTYIHTVGKFNSEFGTQAFPVYQTITEFAGPNEKLDYTSSILLFHEKHSSMLNTLRRYIQTYMKNSSNFENEVYQSSLVQAFGVGVAIQAQRIKKPFSWGTLYWQFNDAWPGISWSSVDYFGRWKALQYQAKRLYEDVAVLFRFHSADNAGFEAIIINDKLYDVECLLTLKVVTTDGKTLLSEHLNFTVKANQAHTAKSMSSKQINEMGGATDRSNVIVYGQVKAAGRTARNTFALVNYKLLQLEKARVKVLCHLANNTLNIRSDKFLKNLFVDLKQGRYLKLSDNYVDVLPDEQMELKVQGDLSKLVDLLQFKSYRESYLNESLEVVVTSV